MKHLLLLAFGLAVAGCREAAPQAEVLNRLKAIETELAKRPVPVRWAYANKSKIQTAIYERTREKLADLKKADALSPEVEAQVSHYETLRMELMRLSVPRPTPMPMPRAMSLPLPPLPSRIRSADSSETPPLPKVTAPNSPPGHSAPKEPRPPTEEEKAYADLSRRVADAKAPVAAIVERRNALTTKYHSPKFLEQLVAEYVKQKEHFDVVVDSSNDYSSSHSVLYRTAGEVPDITEGIIQFFRDKEKP